MRTVVLPGDKEDESADAGGIIFLMIAKDGETPYLGRHPT